MFDQKSASQSLRITWWEETYGRASEECPSSVGKKLDSYLQGQFWKSHVNVKEDIVQRSNWRYHRLNFFRVGLLADDKPNRWWRKTRDIFCQMVHLIASSARGVAWARCARSLVKMSGCRLAFEQIIKIFHSESSLGSIILIVFHRS